MKEFDKWWNNQFSSRKGNNTSHLGYPEAHQAWKAALDLVLSTFNKNIELSDLGNTYDIVDVYSMIEKELQE